MKKVNGVDSVTVSLNEGKASIRFKPESTGKYDDVRGGIEKNGFAVKEAQLRARGTLQRASGNVQFVVAGSGEAFAVVLADPKSVDLERLLQQEMGKVVVIEATIPTPQKNKRQDRLLLKSIRGESKP